MATKEQLLEDGLLDFSMGEFDAAMEKFHQVIARDPNCFDAHHSLGMTYFRKGMLDEAIAAALRSLELKPGDQLAHTSLSMYYARKGLKAEAEHHAARARVAGWKEQLKGGTKPPPS